MDYTQQPFKLPRQVGIFTPLITRLLVGGDMRPHLYTVELEPGPQSPGQAEATLRRQVSLLPSPPPDMDSRDRGVVSTPLLPILP